jgi:hypothetical protein
MLGSDDFDSFHWLKCKFGRDVANLIWENRLGYAERFFFEAAFRPLIPFKPITFIKSINTPRWWEMLGTNQWMYVAARGVRLSEYDMQLVVKKGGLKALVAYHDKGRISSFGSDPRGFLDCAGEQWVVRNRHRFDCTNGEWLDFCRKIQFQ